jgi:CheY-like chemotaxis protein
MTTQTQAILIVDDEPDNRNLFRRLFEFYGFPVFEAADGYAALQITEYLRPALILLDLSMPKLNGWETARRLRRDSRLANVPIIAVSANALPQMAIEAQLAGCDDFITKPVEVDDLVTRVFSRLDRIPA